MTHAFLETPSGRFAYIERGEPDSPVVLCLHGFPDHPPSFVPLMERLAGAGYRAVAPWMRGYAPSVSEGPYHVDRLAEDAVEISLALSPDDPVILIGHDWGAVATYSAVASAPDRFRRAVTMAVPHPLTAIHALRTQSAQRRRSWYMFFFQLPFIPEHVVRRNDYQFIDRLWRTWSPTYTLPADLRTALIDCLDASMPAPIDYYRAQLRPFREAMARARRASELDGITIPMLNLHGENDGCFAPEATLGQERFFAGPFQSHVLPGVGHFLQLEDPDTCANLIVDWLGG